MTEVDADNSEFDISSESDTSSVVSTPGGKKSLDTKSEIQELMLAIKIGLDSLFKASMFIRNCAPNDKRLQAAKTEPFDKCADIMYVNDRYHLLSNKNKELATRLGEANARRRQFFKYCRDKYCRDHNDRLSTAGDTQGVQTGTRGSEKISVRVESVMRKEKTSSQETGSKATAFNAGAAAHAGLLKIDDDLPARSVASFATSVADSSDNDLTFPPVPDDGQTGSPFLCPYCLRTQQLKHEGVER